MPVGARRFRPKTNPIYGATHPSEAPTVIPSVGSAIGANFVLENELASGARSLSSAIEQFWMPSKEGYRPPIETLPDAFKDNMQDFLQARSPEQFAHLLRYRTEELKMRERQAARPVTSFFSGGAAGILSPTSLIGPGAALRWSNSALRGAAYGAAGGFAGITAQEAMLHMSQEYRTKEESYAAMAFGTALSSVFGGIAGQFSKRHYRRLLDETQAFLDSPKLDRTVMYDPEAGLWWRWTPEAVVAYENRIASIVENRQPISTLPRQERLDILKAHGNSYAKAEDVPFMNDDGTVALDTNALDLMLQLEQPYRADLSFEEEAQAALTARERLTFELEQVGDEAIDSPRVGYGSVMRHLVEQHRNEPLEIVIPEPIDVEATQFLERVLGYQQRLREVLLGRQVGDAAARTAADPDVLADDFVETFTQKVGRFTQLRSALLEPRDLQRVDHQARELALREELEKVADEIVDDMMALQAVEVGDVEKLHRKEITDEIRNLKLAVKVNQPRQIETRARKIMKLLGEPQADFEDLLDPQTGPAVLDQKLEAWALRQQEALEQARREEVTEANAELRRLREVIADEQKALIEQAGNVQAARERLLRRITLNDPPQGLAEEWQVVRNQPKVVTPPAGTTSRTKNIGQVRAAAASLRGVYGLRITGTPAQLAKETRIPAFLIYQGRDGVIPSSIRLDREHHYGNPFYKTERAGVTWKATPKRGEDWVAAATRMYREWLEGRHPEIEPNRRDWILEMVDAGHLDNQTFLYYIDDPDFHSHLDELVSFIRERRNLLDPKTEEFKEAADALIQAAEQGRLLQEPLRPKAQMPAVGGRAARGNTVEWLPDGNVEHFPEAVDAELAALDAEIRGHGAGWVTSHLNPRTSPKTHVQGNPGTSYYYSGKLFEGDEVNEWSDLVAEIKTKVERLTGYQFDLALVQRYKGGDTKLGFHRDLAQEFDEAGRHIPRASTRGEDVVVSVNIGATRRFAFSKSRDMSKHVGTIELKDGDVLAMLEGTMDDPVRTGKGYFHSLLPEQGKVGGRINITFRRIDPELQATGRQETEVEFLGDRPVERVPAVRKVISGGQIGADLMGLEVARELQIPTGGMAPHGFETSRGGQKELLEGFGLEEWPTPPKDPRPKRGEKSKFYQQLYVPRTEHNVKTAAREGGGTIIFFKLDKQGVPMRSPGSALTKRFAEDAHKSIGGAPPLINPKSAEEIRRWIADNNVTTVNIAGSRGIDVGRIRPILKEGLQGRRSPGPELAIERVPQFTVAMVRENPDKVYLFGDNLAGRGKGGQAVIRDEPNAVGIPTKKKPSTGADAFFTDKEYSSNTKAIDAAFSKIPDGKTVVIPEDGLGTGRAKLQEKAPKTFRYLQQKIDAFNRARQRRPPGPELAKVESRVAREPYQLPTATKKDSDALQLQRANLLEQEMKLSAAKENRDAFHAEVLRQERELSGQEQPDLFVEETPLSLLSRVLENIKEESRGIDTEVAPATASLLDRIPQARAALEEARDDLLGTYSSHVASRGLLFAEETRLNQHHTLFRAFDPEDELNTLGADILRLKKVTEQAQQSDIERAEAVIAERVSHLRQIQEELAYEQAGVADTRLVAELPGNILSSKQKQTLSQEGIETITEFLAAVGNDVKFKGIGKKTVEKIRAMGIENTETLRTAEGQLVAAIEKERAQLAEQGVIPPAPPARPPGAEGDDAGPPSPFGAQDVTVQAGPMGYLKKLGMIGSTIEQRIMHGSRFKEAKKILMEIKDTNLIIDQNITGNVANPLPVEMMIAELIGLANKALREGPRTQWQRYVAGKNADGSDSGLTPAALRNRPMVVNGRAEFNSLVGIAMHRPEMIQQMPLPIQAHVRASTEVLRSQFYVPMLLRWERTYKTDTLNTDIFSYLLRDWDVGKILSDPQAFKERVFNDMVTQMRKQVSDLGLVALGPGAPLNLRDLALSSAANVERKAAGLGPVEPIYAAADQRVIDNPNMPVPDDWINPETRKGTGRRALLPEGKTYKGSRTISNVGNWLEFREERLRAKIDRWVDAITKKPGGRMLTEDLSTGDLGIEPGKRRSGARRAFHYYDEVLGDVEADFNTLLPYMNTDIEELTTLYARTRVPDLAVITKFEDLGATKAFAALEAEYNMKLKEIEATVAPADVEAQKMALTSGYHRDKTDLQALLDLFRNVYDVPADPGTPVSYAQRAAAALKNFTHERLGGYFGLTALGDAGSSGIMVGFGNAARTVMEEFVHKTGPEIRNAPARDLQNMQVYLEDLMYQRLSSGFEIDPYGPTPTMWEKALNTGSQMMAHLSLLLPWTNGVKQVMGHATLRKLGDVVIDVTSGKVESFDAAIMRSRGGFDTEDFHTLRKLWHGHGTGWDGNARVSFGTETWPDIFEQKSTAPLKAKVRRLVYSFSDRTAPAPKPGDKPTSWHHWVGRLLTMFKGFGFGYTHKILLPALQGLPHGDLRSLSSIGFGIGIASFVYMIRSFLETGEIEDDIDLIIQQGVVRSDVWGKLSTIDEFNSTFTPMPSLMGTLGPKTHHAYEPPSYWQGAVETLAGPAFGTLKQAWRFGGLVNEVASTGSFAGASPEEIRAARRLAPFHSLFYVSWLFHVMEHGLTNVAEEHRFQQPLVIEGNNSK